MEKEEIPLKIRIVENLWKSSDKLSNVNKKSWLLKIWQFVSHKIFILSWVKYYNQHKAISDLIAGITLGLTLIPQSIAYASLANMPSQVRRV